MSKETQDPKPMLRSVMRSICGLTAIALVAAMSGQNAQAFTYTNGSRNPCLADLELYLIDRGITEAEVRSIAIHPHFVNMRDDVDLFGYEVSLRLVGQKMSRRLRITCDCRVASRYGLMPC